MGWWPFSGSSDPVSKLDPKLREFLEKESPKYESQPEPKSSPRAGTQNAPDPVNKKTAAAAAAADGSSEPQNRGVPAESLYQDGRYAHLWKNYRPQSDVEAEGASDHDRLASVYEGFQERKNGIQRAALENCSDQQQEWTDCMKHGRIEDQLQMCRHQVRRFEKCFSTQSRFLRALGYGSTPGRSLVIEEDIQMHADALYQRVLEHEKAVEAAREAGIPPPIFNPVIPQRPAAAAQANGGAPAEAQPSPELQKQWREQLDALPEEERAAEEAALRADLQSKTDVARHLKQHWDAKAEERRALNGGRPTVLDQVQGFFRGGK